jgi:predicted regulator of Ras-like GTPase activity (Roadblock/LC7/MglB family)
MSDASKRLREQRLIFYSDDVEKIDKYLIDFLKLSSAKCAMIIDKEGHMVTQVGDAYDLDLDTISALVAGSFAATKEMARILGETEFADLFHQGEKQSLQLLLVGKRTLLTVIFDKTTTIGMVRLYATEVAKKLLNVFEKASSRKPRESETISKDFTSSAKNRLDDLFGE